MSKYLKRFEMLIGEQGLEILHTKRVIVFGVGGVGGQAAESLVRAGIGHLTFVDRDIIDTTNINRQVIALHSNVGQTKVDALAARLVDINPNLSITTVFGEINATTLDDFNLLSYDFVVDAIDSINDKITLIEFCDQHQLNLISSMGAGNRLDPTKVYVTDVFKTTDDPLAKVVRGLLREKAISKLTVVASKESPIKTNTRTPGSSPFVPPAFGLAIASFITQFFLEYNVK